MCIPYFYDSKPSWKTCCKLNHTNMHPSCLISHTIRKPSRKLVKGCKTRLGFITKIKEKTDKAGNVRELLAIIQIQFITLWEGWNVGLCTGAQSKYSILSERSQEKKKDNCMIPFTWHSRKGKVIVTEKRSVAARVWGLRQWLQGGLGQFRGAGIGTVLCLDWNSGYTTVRICQNSQNCNLKTMNYNYLKING